MRRALALAAACCACAWPAVAQDETPGVTVAFREDAAPFSSKSEDGFTGYIAELCEAAVSAAGYRIVERLPVTATSRGAADVDLVCDPTTVTIERAKRFDFSPILFIANSSFLRSSRRHVLTEEEIALSEDCTAMRAEDPNRDLVGVGMVLNTTSRATFEAARSTGSLRDTLDHALCRFEFESHAAGVAEVCNGYLSYYFGDVDIMLREMRLQEDCTASRAEDFAGAYEPYAVRIPSDDAGFRRAFIAALYGLFADGTALRIYQATFETDRLNEPLKMLFGFNNVPRGQAEAE